MKYTVERKHTNKAVGTQFHELGKVIELSPDDALHPLKNGHIKPKDTVEVSILEGIGPAISKKLATVGIITVTDLSIAKPETIVGAGYEKGLAEDFINKAKLYIAEQE